MLRKWLHFSVIKKKFKYLHKNFLRTLSWPPCLQIFKYLFFKSVNKSVTQFSVWSKPYQVNKVELHYDLFFRVWILYFISFDKFKQCLLHNLFVYRDYRMCAVLCLFLLFVEYKWSLFHYLYPKASVFGVKDSDLKLVSLYCSKRSHLKQIRSLSETLKNSPYATTVFWVWANALRVFRSFKHHKNLEPMANWEFIVGVFSHQQMGFNLLNPI